jgi:hypothetical protein
LLKCRTGAVETAANASRGCAGLHTAKPHPNAPPRGICRTALLCHIQTGRRLHVRLVATDPPPSQQTARPGASQPAGKPLGYSAPPLPRPASAPNENVTNSHWQSGTASAASLPARVHAHGHIYGSSRSTFQYLCLQSGASPLRVRKLFASPVAVCVWAKPTVFHTCLFHEHLISPAAACKTGPVGLLVPSKSAKA